VCSTRTSRSQQPTESLILSHVWQLKSVWDCSVTTVKSFMLNIHTPWAGFPLDFKSQIPQISRLCWEILLDHLGCDKYIFRWFSVSSSSPTPTLLHCHFVLYTYYICKHFNIFVSFVFIHLKYTVTQLEWYTSFTLVTKKIPRPPDFPCQRELLWQTRPGQLNIDQEVSTGGGVMPWWCVSLDSRHQLALRGKEVRNLTWGFLPPAGIA